MKQITKYQATDGSVFTTEQVCLKYETDEARVIEIMSNLFPPPCGCAFQNETGLTPAQLAARVVELEKGMKRIYHFRHHYNAEEEMYNTAIELLTKTPQ